MVQVVQTRNELATQYGVLTPFIALATTAPGATAGTEVTGGTYARKPSNWGAAAASQITATPAAHDVPSGVAVAGINMMSALTGGIYKDGSTVPSQQFSSAGTYQVTATYTQA